MWLGINNYDPQFLENTNEFASKCSVIVRRLRGKELQGVYVLWNLTLDEWYKDAPVIVIIGDSQIELCANKLDEFSISTGTIDMSVGVEPLDLGEIGVWKFEWRVFPLEKGLRQKATEFEVIEYRFKTTIVQDRDCPQNVGHETEGWLLCGFGICLEHGYVAVHNSLDENTIVLSREVDSDFRYTLIK